MFARILSVICASAASLLAFPAFADAPRPVVIELFTLQGCSSCPPADSYLNDLSDARKDVLPLAFHVTYWNQLGWKDPFSLSISDARQDRYVQRFHGFAYTPELVVDGKSAVVGSNRAAVDAVIDRARSSATTSASVSAMANGKGVTVSIGSGSGQAQVLLVGYDTRHVTPVGRGENSGNTLTESNIVRALASIGSWSGPALTLQASPPAGEKLAVLLEAPDGTIVGAARVADARVEPSR